MPRVGSQPGEPLYTTVKQAIIRAIDGGHFDPNKRLPSTKQLSEQMSVSLVTAHRALQELVGEGFLDRSRGKGTYIVDRASRAVRKLRVSVMIHREVSLVDEHHSRLLEGMRQASASTSPADRQVELTVSQYGSRLADEWDGVLLLDPVDNDLAECVERLPAKAAKLIVGSNTPVKGIGSVGVNQCALAELVVNHLVEMGHQRIGFLGSARLTAGNRELFDHFVSVAAQRGLQLPDQHIIRVEGWHVDDKDKMRLFYMLDRADAPTAIVTAGYHFGLDAYEAAATLGRAIPQELSIVGIGNPASAGYLSPPLTCVHEPLVELGHAAVHAIVDAIENPRPDSPKSRTLRPELIIRKSVASL